MYNLAKKDEVVNLFTDLVDQNAELVKRYGDLYSEMKKDNAEMVRYLVTEVHKSISKAVPVEMEIPKVTMHVAMSGTESEIRVIDLILRNKQRADYAFKMKRSIVSCENIMDEVVDFLKCSYVELIVDFMVRENLKVVNEKLVEIGKAANNEFVVKVVSPMQHSGSKIADILDDQIVFVADEERALSLDDILVFCKPNDLLTEEAIQAGFDMEVAKFAEAQTTPQFVGVHDPLIGYICDISKLVKPITLIKKAYPKSIDKLRGSKETLAHYRKDSMFCVISVSEEGNVVVLNPFNTETLENMSMDALEGVL